MDRTVGADRFCASSDWAFAAAASFPEAGPPLVVTDGTSHCGTRLVRRPEDGTRILVGLDPVWGFGTPIVGDPAAAARCLAARLRDRDWDVAVLAGQRPDLPMTHAIADALGPRLYVGPAEHRLRASLAPTTGGLDGWWARRSGRFRQRLRRIERDAAAAGVEVEAVPVDGPAVVDRLVALERRGWKGREGTGLASAELAALYQGILARVAPTGRGRLLVARRAGRDVGYVLGAVRRGTYRGFQLSYADEVASLGVGHLLQLHEVRRAAAEGLDTYDLGMDMPYKHRWSDVVDSTVSVVVTR